MHIQALRDHKYGEEALPTHELYYANSGFHHLQPQLSEQYYFLTPQTREILEAEIKYILFVSGLVLNRWTSINGRLAFIKWKGVNKLQAAFLQ